MAPIDILKKILPVVNYFAGFAVAGLGAFYFIFGYHWGYFGYFGPLFQIIFAGIMLSSDLGLKPVRELCKFLDYFLGRGAFYIYIAIMIQCFSTIYNYGSTDCNFFCWLYTTISFWTYWALLGVGGFCVFIHFVTADKQISFDTTNPTTVAV
jgi:hypothetical protein